MKLIPVFFPPRLWPHRYQYALVAMALACVCGLGILALSHTQQGLREVQSSLASASAELARYKQSARELASAVKNVTQNAASDLPALPSSSTINQVISDMTKLAGQHRVQLANLSIEATAKSAQAVAQQQITVQAKGDYAGLKAWTGEMLGRYPWLAVKSLSWQSTEMALDATVTWVLYVQD